MEGSLHRRVLRDKYGSRSFVSSTDPKHIGEGRGEVPSDRLEWPQLDLRAVIRNKKFIITIYKKKSDRYYQHGKKNKIETH